MKIPGMILGLVLLAGCSRALANEQQTLDAARATWTSAGVDTYRFDFQWQCFCPNTTPVTIDVTAGTITGIVDEQGTVIDPTEFDRYRPIEALFDLVQDAIDRRAYLIRIEYDNDRGFPTSAFIDYQEFTIDEEQGFAVSNVNQP